MHPTIVKLVYSHTYSDSMWRRHFVRTTALEIAMRYLAKISMIATWVAVYAAQHYTWTRDKMGCFQMNFQQACEYAGIGTWRERCDARGGGVTCSTQSFVVVGTMRACLVFETH